MTLRILLIDDNPDDRYLIVRQLERDLDSLQFIEIIDAVEFDRALERGEFELAIVDYQLRWSNGLKILHALKQEYPEVPVVMFTNSGNEEIAVEAMKAGLDDYVVKSPKHYSRLSVAVRSAWQRRQAELRVEDLETELESLLNRLDVGVFCTTPDRQLLEGNAAFLRLLGVADLSAAQALLANQWRSLLGDVSGDTTYEQQTEVELRRRDGSSIWVEVSKMFRNRDGQPAIDALVEDISARKRLERERARVLEREKAAREAAETANRLKDEFLAIVSHELRSPLNAILGWSSMLRSRKLSEAKTAIALETIERNAKLQTQLIEDLLDTSRLVRGTMHLSVGRMQLVPAIEAAIATVSLAAETKGIAIRKDIDPDVGPVLGDPHRFQQVVWNLLSNAVKFTDSGGAVEVRLERVGDEAQLQVTDTGKGMDAEFVAFAFDRFRQANATSTRSVGGLGLGLAIVRQLVEMHGGTVSASSPGPGQGSTFTVRLPLDRAAIGNATHPDESSNGRLPEGSSFSPLRGVRLLIVDDEKDARDFLAIALEEYGAEVMAVGSAPEAKRAISRFHPAILVSDIGMPGEDGFDLIRQLRETGVSIPAIALSAYARSQDAKQALDAGFELHLAKPIESERLVEAIGALLTRETRLA